MRFKVQVAMIVGGKDRFSTSDPHLTTRIHGHPASSLHAPHARASSFHLSQRRVASRIETRWDLSCPSRLRSDHRSRSPRRLPSSPSHRLRGDILYLDACIPSYKPPSRTPGDVTGTGLPSEDNREQGTAISWYLAGPRAQRPTNTDYYGSSGDHEGASQRQPITTLRPRHG